MSEMEFQLNAVQIKDELEYIEDRNHLSRLVPALPHPIVLFTFLGI